MAKEPKTVKASSIKTREQFEKACKEGWYVIYDEGYPQAPGNRPKKNPTKKGKE